MAYAMFVFMKPKSAKIGGPRAYSLRRRSRCRRREHAAIFYTLFIIASIPLNRKL